MCGQWRHDRAPLHARAVANGNVYLSDGFDAEGKVQFNGARIRGNIDCRGASFRSRKVLNLRILQRPAKPFPKMPYRS